MPKQHLYQWPTLDGGMVTAISPRVLEAHRGYGVMVKNLEFTDLGIPKKRPGILAKFGTTAASIKGIHEFIKASTRERYVLAAHGSVVQVYQNGTWANVHTGLTGEGRVSFLTFADSVLGANGVDPSFRWDGVSNTTPSQFPKAKYLAEFRLRVAAAGDPDEPSLLHLSHTGDPTLWDVQDPASNATKIYVSPDDGEGITGILNIGEGGLLIGKPSAIYGLFGYARQNFAVDLLDPNVGVVSHWSLVYAQPTAYFVARTGVYQMTLGDHARLISHAVQDQFETKVNKNRLEESQGFLVGRNYVVALPTGESEFITYAYQIDRGVWSHWTAPHVGCTARVIADQEHPDSLLYFTLPQGNQIFACVPTVTNDNGEPFDVEYESLELDCGYPETQKDIHTLFVTFRRSYSSYPVKVYVRGDVANWEDWQQVAGLSIDGLPNTQQTEQIPIGMSNVRYFQVKLVASSTDAQCHPIGLSIQYSLTEV